VAYAAADGVHHVRAALTVGADGRFSKVRQLGGFELVRRDEPRDILWFRVRKSGDLPHARPGLYTRPGLGYVVMVPRGAEWQIGYTLPKGRYKQLLATGLPALREAVVTLVPWLAGSIDDLRDWKQTSLLSVESGRVRRWYRPGLLLIGDAAHTMSPVGGVGINCAIQDAVATANLLGPRLRVGSVRPRDLAAVQRSREWSVRVTQACQRVMQHRLLHGGLPDLLLRLPLARRLLRRVLALGVRRVGLDAAALHGASVGAGRWPVGADRWPAPLAGSGTASAPARAGSV
jgi:2-polyprenyl-6-methoxyphenol hydroxylase-like FAD-dependent oxidoreductase